MKVKEYLKDANLWGAISKVESFPFIGGNEKLLNELLLFRYGGRTIYSTVEEMDVENLAGLIVLTYSDKWNTLINLLDSEETTKGGSFREVKEIIKTLEERKGANNNLNKVSAFDSEELIINDGNDSENSDHLDGNVERTLTDNYGTISEAFEGLSIREKHSIIRTVTDDVIGLISLSIY